MNSWTPSLPLFTCELILESSESYFSIKRLKEATPNLQPEETTIGWALCSTHFVERVFIAPERLNNISIDDNYQEVSNEQMKKEYLNLHITIVGFVIIKENIVSLLYSTFCK